MHVVDWLVVALYVGTILTVGWWHSRQKADAKEYFLGSGKVHPFFAGISLYVALLSINSYLTIPGELIQHGPVDLCSLLAIPFSYIVVGYFLIPALMRVRAISAYELLEARLGKTVRRITAAIFILSRILWMALIMYVASTSIAVILGFGPGAISRIAIASAVVTLTYTSLGGMRAVVKVDFIQFSTLFAGAVVTVLIITFRMGGLDWFPIEWATRWDRQPVFSLDPTVRATVVGAIVLQFLFVVCASGSDQILIQRFMSTKDAAAARRAFLTKSLANVAFYLLIALVCFAVLGFYSHRPELIPAGETIRSFADRLFPHFITSELPIGLKGIVVAALFAAAGTLDSGVNAITAVISRDFVTAAWQKNASEVQKRRLAVGVTLAIGILVLVLATQLGRVPGNYQEVGAKTSNLFPPIIFALFFMALFVRFSTPFGAGLGAFYGLIAGISVGYWDVLVGGARLSFQYYMLFILIVQLPVSCAVSLIPFARLPRSLELVCRAGLIAPLVGWTIFLFS